MSFTPANFNVWAEIPVRNLDAGIAYYGAVTGGTVTKMEMGGDAVAVFEIAERKEGVSLNLLEGDPGDPKRGPVVFLAVEGALEAAIDRVWNAGGKVLGEPISIPPGRFVYTADPDGNRIGLFEPAA